MENSSRARIGRGLTAVLVFASVAAAGILVAGRGDPEKTTRSTIQPTEEASDARIVDKDQVVDIDSFDEEENPLWPLTEKPRSAAPQN